MKKLALMMLGLAAALPLHAQDATPPPPESATPPADASAPPADATAAPAETPSADAAAPADASSAPAADTPPASTEAAPATAEAAPATTEAAPATTEAAPATTEAAPATTEAAPESAPAEATTESTPTVETTSAPSAAEAANAAASESKPWILYVGGDYGSVKVSLSDNLGGQDFASKYWQIRGGMRLTDAIGLEAHYGQGIEDDENKNQPRLDRYYGLYLVPTGTLLDVVEFGFPLGFAWTDLRGANNDKTLDGVSYGMNVEFPIKLLIESAPDIRLGGGGMVFQQNNDARTYGWHVGLRMDFAI